MCYKSDKCKRGGWADCIYLDLRKAFDKVLHRRLIWKLEKIGGPSRSLLKWMTDFLTNREMRTVIKGTKSNWRTVISGVTQGSVLAPIMFTVYVNDMTEGEESYMNLFADDATIIRKVTNEEDCNALNQDLIKINEWSLRKNMECNAKKM